MYRGPVRLSFRASASLRGALTALALCAAMVPGAARAEDAKPEGPPTKDLTAADVNFESDKAVIEETLPTPPPEAPPMAPRHKGVVLDANAGALFFLGQAGKVATPAPHFRIMLGYELFNWLMLFGEGELAFSTTARAEDQPYTRAFPIFGFGGGARGTVHLTPRVALFAEASLGFLQADIAHGALANLGLANAEKLGFFIGGRGGFEWYQLDRHFALGLGSGVRLATGFSRQGGSSDTPLLLETQASLRYTF